MKAHEIRNKAVADLLMHAKFEIRNIIDHRIRLGEMDENTDEEYYEIPVFGFGVEGVTIAILVGNTYDEEECYESRTIKEFIDHDGTVYIRTEEDDELSLRELPFDTLVAVVAMLEEMWTNLIAGK